MERVTPSIGEIETPAGVKRGFRLAQGNRRKCFERVDMAHGPPTQDPPEQGQSR